MMKIVLLGILKMKAGLLEMVSVSDLVMKIVLLWILTESWSSWDGPVGDLMMKIDPV